MELEYIDYTTREDRVGEKHATLKAVVGSIALVTLLVIIYLS